MKNSILDQPLEIVSNPMPQIGSHGGTLKVVNPNQFLEMFRDRSIQILDLKLIPPDFGDGGFGNFLIEYKECP